MKRECGDCQLCCTVLAIKEVPTSGYTTCRHQCATGCDIYEDRPNDCMNWSCIWVTDSGSKITRNKETPRKIGVFFSNAIDKSQRSSQQILGFPLVLAHEIRPGAADKKLARRAINRFLRRGAVIILVKHPEPWDDPDARPMHIYMGAPAKVSKAKARGAIE